jgi:uncharacterized protein (TIGR02453 family)
MNEVKDILRFLKNLDQNNSKEWMQDHKSEYLIQKQAFSDLVQHTIDELAVTDPRLRGLDPKDCIFRINRDIRFSKDKTLYKTHFGAYMAPGGRKSMLPGYYLHLQPGNKSILASGLYRPTGNLLSKVRQEIDYNGDGLVAIVESKSWKDTFGNLQGERLIKAPKGYTMDHPLIHYLQLKSYLAVRSFQDSETTAADFPHESVQVFKKMKPLVDFLNTAIS